MELSRRALLIGALAGGGLAVGYTLRPREYPLPLQPGRDETAFGAWIKITRDGVVSVAVPQLEMGQGVSTLIPHIAAVELGADWRYVAVEPAPASALYANLPLAARWARLWMPAFAGLADDPDGFLAKRFAKGERFTVTADGTSLTAYEGPVRAAAASARALLMMAAGERWDTDWRKLEARDGHVWNGRQRLPFGQLAAEAVHFDPPETPLLREKPAHERASEFTTGARLAFPRLDLPSKVDGSHVFAGDVRLPGMVYAAIRHGPIAESTLTDYEAGEAKGLIGVVKGPDWLAVVAKTWWAAEQALTAMAPRFATKHRADSGRIEAALDKAVRFGTAYRLVDAGDDDLERDFTFARRYDVAPAIHATLETASATARLTDGRLELWLATQAPEAARRAVAKALDVSLEQVVLYPVSAGGSFDRRLEFGHAIEAALIARDVKLPVQLTWSRWQEHVAGLPRTPVAAFMGAKLAGGALTGWKARIALPATALEFGERLFGGRNARDAMAASKASYDPLAIEGGIPPYAIPSLRVEHVPASINLPTGRLRGNAHGYTAFFNESFVDELAHHAGQEPLSFRIAMLGHDPRLIQCMQRAAQKANWGGGSDASGQGLACHAIGDGRIAVVATAQRSENGVRVDRITAAVDIGRIVNADIARQQIEGGIVYGIGLALGSSVGYAEGLPATGRLAELGLPLLADCPAIEVEFLESEAPPADPGELGVAVAAPALANALFSATGLRFRKLPLLSEEI